MATPLIVRRLLGHREHAIDDQEATMHPLGLYLAERDRESHHGWADPRRARSPFARVDAPPLPEPEPRSVSRAGRAVAMIRQLVARPAGA